MSASREPIGILSKARLLEPPLTPEAPIRATLSTHAAEALPQYDVHLACEVGFVLAGTYRRLYEGFERKVSRGQMWLCGPCEPHGHQVIQEPARPLVITFLLEFLWDGSTPEAPWGRLFLSQSRAARDLPLSPSESRAARALALEVLEECRSRRPYHLAAARLALQKLLLPLLRRSAAAQPAKSGHDVGCVARAMDMVNQKLPGPIRLNDACKATALGRSQFCSVFQRTTGITFTEFVRRARLAGAAHELMGTEQKIAAIARRWGYADQSHLHRVFKEVFRCTPSDYRCRRTV